MLAIEFNFLGGRYHATPWGRHVNEAEVGWPPDPWRITRALLATWHRKLDPDRYARADLRKLLAKLASEPPVYRLPEAVHAHTRQYLPVIEGMHEKRTLVFDTFARVNAPLQVVWRNCELSSDETTLLDTLLENLGYLGRAEAWVEARVLSDRCGEVNCEPGEDAIDPETGELREVVTLFLAKAPEAYREFRETALMTERPTKKSDRAKLESTLPEDWLDAIATETAQLQAVGWSAPPAAEKRHYLRPARALAPIAKTGVRPMTQSNQRPTIARFILYGKPLPRIELALQVGEWARTAVLGRAKWSLGEDRIPSVLSGHGMADDNRHGHAFYLPEDADADGRIDHLLVYAPDGFGPDAVRTLAELSWLKDSDGQKLPVMLEGLGAPELFNNAVALCGVGTIWESVTPYLHPWHRKKNFGVLEQLQREFRERGVPAELLNATALTTERRVLEFARYRRKRGLTQPDKRGGFFRLEFDRPVSGPMAFGFGCHFGLGLFRVASPDAGDALEPESA
ncbi:MAG: type I-U CRISPR-associated protein Csb2 [Thiotrichales bacterium]